MGSGGEAHGQRVEDRRSPSSVWRFGVGWYRYRECPCPFAHRSACPIVIRSGGGCPAPDC